MDILRLPSKLLTIFFVSGMGLEMTCKGCSKISGIYRRTQLDRIASQEPTSLTEKNLSMGANRPAPVREEMPHLIFMNDFFWDKRIKVRRDYMDSIEAQPISRARKLEEYTKCKNVLENLKVENGNRNPSGDAAISASQKRVDSELQHLIDEANLLIEKNKVKVDPASFDLPPCIFE